MDLGIFDHLDRREGVPLDEFYESRLRLLEKYDRVGFAAYHLAEHHATPLGLAPVPGIFLAQPPSAPGAFVWAPASTACPSTTRFD